MSENTKRKKERKITAVLSVITVCILLCGSAVRKLSEPRVICFSEYCIERGDTLWSIARSVTPQSADIRKTVDLIRQKNKIDGSVIYEGEVLFVPQYENFPIDEGKAD